MLNILAAIFIVLHGLVHLWYVVLGQQMVEFQPDMGWTGESWLLSSFMAAGAVRTLASGLYALAALGFVVIGIGMFVRADWWQMGLVGTAVFSSIIIILFWDGSGSLLVQKGLLGLLINIAAVIAVMVRR